MRRPRLRLVPDGKGLESVPRSLDLILKATGSQWRGGKDMLPGVDLAWRWRSWCGGGSESRRQGLCVTLLWEAGGCLRRLGRTIPLLRYSILMKKKINLPHWLL